MSTSAVPTADRRPTFLEELNRSRQGNEAPLPSHAGPRTPVRDIGEMEERKDPTFIQFDTQGTVAEGTLLKIERIQIGEDKKLATRYTILDIDSGEVSAFLGTYAIDTKLRPQDQGHYIRVVFEGVDANIGRNGNSMKLFSVRVSKRPAHEFLGKTNTDGSPLITDADIPF